MQEIEQGHREEGTGQDVVGNRALFGHAIVADIEEQYRRDDGRQFRGDMEGGVEIPEAGHRHNGEKEQHRQGSQRQDRQGDSPAMLRHCCAASRLRMRSFMAPAQTGIPGIELPPGKAEILERHAPSAGKQIRKPSRAAGERGVAGNGEGEGLACEKLFQRG
ncbi:MAG: hypothetical protein HZC22_06330 [Rhodocyclales bacterium]|nr:hypothetical protein [Rhodocyclales bacterium]